MTPPTLDRLALHAAVDALEWGLQHLSEVLNFPIDPARLREQARRNLGAGPTYGAEELLAAFRRAAEALKFSCVPLQLTGAELLTRQVPFPLVTVTRSEEGPRWVVITERKADKVLVRTGPESCEWYGPEELASLLGAKAVGFVHCVVAAPMESVSVHSRTPGGGEEVGEHRLLRHLRPWERVSKLIKLERDDVWVVVMYSAAVGLLSLATPIAVQSLVTTVAFGTLLQPIVVLAVLFLVALGFQAVLKALQARVIEALQVRVFARTALDIAWRIPRARRDEHHPVTPELVNRFFDVLTVQKSFAQVLTEGLSAFMQITIGLLVLAFYHPALLALAIIIILSTNLLILLPIRRGVRTSFEESRHKYEVGAWLEELARAPSAFRGTGGTALAAARADGLVRQYISARRRHFTVVYGQTVSALAVQVIASAVLLGFGGFLVVNEGLTLGQLIAAEIIVAAVTNSIAKFGKILESTYDLVTGLSKVGHLIDLEVDLNETGELLPGSGPVGVKLTNVECEGHHLSFEVKPGARTAIVGPTGYALADLLAGLSQPEHGTYEIHGVDVRRASGVALHDQVMLVRREDVFTGTVFENVSLTRPGVTPADVRAAVERVGLDDDIRALERGYDTELGFQGSPLTPSQTLRLVVARALAAAPRLIVIDDSLDGLDPVVRSRVVSALTRKDAPWTLIALVNDPGCALARACGDVRDLHTLSHPPVEGAHEAHKS